MPTRAEQKRMAELDAERRRLLVDLHNLTGRNVIVFASAWLQRPEEHDTSARMGMDDGDFQGMADVCGELEGPDLDLIVHNPGGYASSARIIGNLLRDRFDHIRVFVPLMAQSSATLLTLMADEIWMAGHSFLAPNDARLHVRTALGYRWVSALDVLSMFDRVATDSHSPDKLRSYTPLMRQMGPDLLVRCENELDLARRTAEQWLAAHMFDGVADGADKARQVADALSDRRVFVSAQRHLSAAWLREHGLPVHDLEADAVRYSLVVDAHRAVGRSLEHVAKIIENHRGGLWATA